LAKAGNRGGVMKAREVGPIKILTPKGYLTGGDETDELQKSIESLSEGGNKSLIINLARPST